MNILIPCAGRGSRFIDAGFVLPKPLIDVNGMPMLQRVIRNIDGVIDQHIVIVQSDHWKEHYKTFGDVLPDDTYVILTEGVTEGAACTVLLAKTIIDDDTPLFLANSDQVVKDWDIEDFLMHMETTQADGGIVTFEATGTKWSYARCDDEGNVLEVAEKRPISSHATVGFYWWRKGSDFVKYATQMINKNIRTNNEFYVAPVFNEAIEDGKRILAYPVSGMQGLGTPEDLQHYLSTL